MMNSILTLAVLWYLIGSVGGLWISKKIYPIITKKDLVFLFTIGGIGGLLTIYIGLTFLLNYSDKDKSK